MEYTGPASGMERIGVESSRDSFGARSDSSTPCRITRDPRSGSTRILLEHGGRTVHVAERTRTVENDLAEIGADWHRA